MVSTGVVPNLGLYYTCFLLQTGILQSYDLHSYLKVTCEVSFCWKCFLKSRVLRAETEAAGLSLHH